MNPVNGTCPMTEALHLRDAVAGQIRRPGLDVAKG